MRKLLLLLTLTALCLTPFSQSNTTQYLEKNRYPFSIDTGFDLTFTDTLSNKFKDFRLILQAEGGSHHLNFYNKLQLIWTKLLYEKFELKHIFLEFGAPAAVCVNNYLATGDTTKLYNSLYLKNKPNMDLWKPYFDLNKNINVSFFGIDFNRPSSYLKALKQLIPTRQPPEILKTAIRIIKDGDESINECSHIQKINATLRNELSKNKHEFINYFSQNYNDFERIIMNKGTCKDEKKNRNFNMVENFLSFDSNINDRIYYGELGIVHTILKNKDFAQLLNQTEKFKNKVCVINLYCCNCTTPEEKVSNYPLIDIEKDILQYFVPLCNSDFTIFDLSGNSTLISKYKEYGQFLIIAKNQN